MTSRNKKVEEEKASKEQITTHFQSVEKSKKSKPEQKRKSVLKNTSRVEKEVDLIEIVVVSAKKTCLYLVVDTLPERDCIVGHRKVLGKFITAMKNVDPDAVLTYYKDQSEKSNGRYHNYAKSCIDLAEKVPSSIVQIQKYFLKGRPKKVGGTVFTNILIAHNEDIDNMLEELRRSLERYNRKIRKQRIQHCNAVKI